MAAVHSSSAGWDIFCKVVDNYGDAGVCWRLALMLDTEHHLQVRLWIDNPAALHALNPDLDPALPEQQVGGVRVMRWSGEAKPTEDTVVVIEAFGCGLPESYVSAMAARTRPPLWIVLEYLSAEAWVDEHHALASPHPRLPLPRFYFFPGFTPRTGGLLREADLIVRRDAFDAARKRLFWQKLGFAEPDRQALTASLFCYADAPVTELLAVLAEGREPVVLAVPEGAPWPAVERYFGIGGTARTRTRGALEVRLLPFLSQSGYDELLWACDLNLVRGEDSFVRAQWAARPMLWQPYRQDDAAHLRKMEAFLGRYCTGLTPPAAVAVAAFWRAWSGEGDITSAWPEFRSQIPVLQGHAKAWAVHLAQFRDLAAQLVEFARGRVE